MSDNEAIIEDMTSDTYFSDIETNDLLVNDLYSKERGVRVEFYDIQLDEMCGAARADFRR